MIVYWFDFVITTMTTIYLAIQWFIFTDHSTPEKNNFEFESILSIVILTLFRLFHVTINQHIKTNIKTKLAYRSTLLIFSLVTVPRLNNTQSYPQTKKNKAFNYNNPFFPMHIIIPFFSKISIQ